MKMPSLNTQILIGAILGILLGIYCHQLGPHHSTTVASVYAAGLVGGLFIDLLKMILIPLVF